MIDDTKRHGQAMKLLEEAGIYVFTGVATRFNTINRLEPYQSYHSSAVSEFFRVVDVMAKYPNTLGLLAASNVINNPQSQSAAPVVRAVVRDLKRYMQLKNSASGQRILPIGYSAAAVQSLLGTTLKYLSLGDPRSSIDFFTVSSAGEPVQVCTNGVGQFDCYQWAGRASMQISGYDALVDSLQDAALPIFMSEYGTNILSPRLFQETAALYSPQMSQVFSGGCVYEFFEEVNRYGLVEFVDQDQGRNIPAGTVERRRTERLARSDNPRKTADKRQTDRGILSIFHDFVNYKENLDATRDIESTWEGDVMEREAAERGNVDLGRMSWPWEPENQLPDNVVNWAQLEDQINGGGLI